MRIAIANLKGGVGKSTTTLILAEYLALAKDLRVLVLDFDPQSNSSFMLLSRGGIELAESQHKTLPHFMLSMSNQSTRTAGSYIYTGASDLIELDRTRSLNKRGKIDVLPSVPKMWFVEYDLTKKLYAKNQEPAEEFKNIIASGLDSLQGSYDVILIDCPPGFSMLTRAGLMLCDAVISPTIADEVSVRSLRDFKNVGIKEILGNQATDRHYVVVSKFNSTKHTRSVLENLKKDYDVIDPPIKYSNDIVNAAYFIDIGSRRSFASKYVRMQNDVKRLGSQIYGHVIKAR